MFHSLIEFVFDFVKEMKIRSRMRQGLSRTEATALVDEDENNIYLHA